MGSMIMRYYLGGITYEVITAYIICSKVFMIVIYSSIYNSNNNIAVTGSIRFPYRNDIDIRTTLMTLSSSVVIIMPLLRQLRIIEVGCTIDLSYRLNQLDTWQSTEVSGSLGHWN